jgi:hypothetical protein
MPSTSEDFIRVFFDPNGVIEKRTFKVNADDYKLVQSVFAEPGFLQYFPGAMFKKLADHLRKENIDEFTQRKGTTETITSILSHFHIDGEADESDDR